MTTSLHDAVEQGDLAAVLAALPTADPNALTADWAPLHIAAKAGTSSIAKSLIQEGGANVNLARSTGATPLFIAAGYGHSELVEFFLDCGACPDAAKENGATPLFIACQGGFGVIVERLLATGAVDVNAATDSGARPLYSASVEGHVAVVKALLAAGASVNAVRPNGGTALFAACQHGHVDVASALLNGGADIEIGLHDGTTPLAASCLRGQVRTAKLLIEAGANVDAGDSEGFFPLFIASQIGSVELVELLVVAGAGLNAQHSSGATALFVAAQCGYTAVVGVLLAGGADPSLASDTGTTPLGVVEANRRSELVALLRECGGRVNGTTRAGTPSVVVAAKRGDLGLVRSCLAAGESELGSRVAREFRLALWWAVACGNDDVAAELLGPLSQTGGAATDQRPLSLQLLTCLAAHQGNYSLVSLFTSCLSELVNASEPTCGKSAVEYAALAGHRDVVELLATAGAEMGAHALRVVSAVEERLGSTGGGGSVSRGGSSVGSSLLASASATADVSSAPTVSVGAVSGGGGGRLKGSGKEASVENGAGDGGCAAGSECGERDGSEERVEFPPDVEVTLHRRGGASAAGTAFPGTPTTTSTSTAALAAATATSPSTPTTKAVGHHPATSPASSTVELEYADTGAVGVSSCCQDAPDANSGGVNNDVSADCGPASPAWGSAERYTTDDPLSLLSPDGLRLASLSAAANTRGATIADECDASTTVSAYIANRGNRGGGCDSVSSFEAASTAPNAATLSNPHTNHTDNGSGGGGGGETTVSDDGVVGGGHLDRNANGKGSAGAKQQPVAVGSAMEELINQLFAAGDDFVFTHILPTVTLGQGAFGKVMCGWYIDRQVAFKLERQRRSDTVSAGRVARLASFAHEARMLGLVAAPTHARCLAFLGVAVSPDIGIALVTEYVSGGDLRHYLRRNGGLSPVAGLSLAIGLASGLGYLHETGMVHGDIKPENILLCSRGEGGDGVTRTAGSSGSEVGGGVSGAEASTAALEEVLAGKWIDFGGGYPYWRGRTALTPRYSAPELVTTGLTEAGSDVYSFACVVAELFVCSKPDFPRGLLASPFERQARAVRGSGGGSDSGLVPHSSLATTANAGQGGAAADLAELLPEQLRGTGLAELLASCWQLDVYSRPRTWDVYESLVAIAHRLDGGQAAAAAAVASIGSVAPTGNGVLMTACRYLDVGVVSQLVKRDGEHGDGVTDSPTSSDSPNNNNNCEADASSGTTSEQADTQNVWGHTPLHVAASLDNEELLTLLLASDPPPQLLLDNAGNSPLDLAYYHDHSCGGSHFALPLLLAHARKLASGTQQQVSPGGGSSGGSKGSANAANNATTTAASATTNGNNSTGGVPSTLTTLSALHVAVEQMDAGRVEMLVAGGADVNAVSGSGETPVHVAARVGASDILRRLLGDWGAAVDAKNGNGVTALDEAAKLGRADIVAALVDAGSDVSATDSNGRTALWKAAYVGATGVASSLVEAGADVNGACAEGWTPVMVAAQNGHASVVEVLLRGGADVSTADSEGWTALLTAARGGHVAVVAALLTAGASVSATTTTGWTALMSAAEVGSVPVVTALSDSGAAVDAANASGWTALIVAAHRGHAAVVKCLVAGGAAVDSATASGWTALIAAADGGHTDVVAELLGAGASVDATNDSGWTALHVACQESHSAVAAALLGSGANVETEQDTGWRPLHVAAQCENSLPTLQVLVGAGAEVNAVNQSGQTALAIAAKAGSGSGVAYLVSCGADVSLRDASGSTSLCYAAQSGSADALTSVLAGFPLTPTTTSACATNSVTEAATDTSAGSVSDGTIDTRDESGGAARIEWVNATNTKGWTALMHAARVGPPESVAALLGAGASTDTVSESGWTALIIAAYYGNTQSVSYLLDAGAAVDAQSTEGWTALGLASQNGSDGVVRVLLAAGADPNLSTNAGVTPLFAACYQGHTAVVSALLHARADATLAPDCPPPANEDILSWTVGQTPRDVASVNGHTDVVAALDSTLA